MMNLEDYSLVMIFVVSLVAILGASEIGRVLGVRATGRAGDRADIAPKLLAKQHLNVGLIINYENEEVHDRSPGWQGCRNARKDDRSWYD
jgi:hypothetical protein